MLIYCCNLSLQPAGGIDEVLGCIAKWLGKRSKSFVDPSTLVTMVNERLRDGSRVEVSTTKVDQSEARLYPFLACIRLSHPDDKVPGRQWVAEIGIEQAESNSSVRCTVLSQTNEISTRVNAPVRPTRPRVVELLAQTCSPTEGTPGLQLRTLTDTNAAAFVRSLEHRSRTTPWVVISPTREGEYLVQPRRVLSLLVGTADVFVIPTGADTFAIEREIGTKYAAWLGAVNVIHPLRVNASDNECDTVRLLPSMLEEIIEEGGNAEDEILAAVTHRMNLPNSWKHISGPAVAHARLRQQLALALSKAKESDQSEEFAELLDAADSELKEKAAEIKALQEDVEDRDALIERLRSDVDSLKYSLNGRRANGSTRALVDVPTALREAVLAAINGEPTLEQSLGLISTLFPDRIVVLESAYESAQESNGFRYLKRALELFLKLATDYWTTLAAAQGGDAKAKQVFGDAYAAREADTLSKDGLKRRTFSYNGMNIEMMKHLKIGIKDSNYETLRVHFEWLAKEKKIVIGHCGGHLDF